jgi:hypothetical protein
MADTGSPWNLPYPLPTDLVKDGADDIKALAEATATGLSGIPVLAGIGTNVVQTVKTDEFSTTSGTFGNITGFSVAITPTSATSKVLLIASLVLGSTGTSGSASHVRFSGGNTSGYIGDASGSQVRATYGLAWETSTQYLALSATLVFLDSPATTSSTTYNVQMRRGTGGTAFLNRQSPTDNAAYMARSASSFTVIEVSA